MQGNMFEVNLRGSLYCYMAEAYLGPPGEELLVAGLDRHLWDGVGMVIGKGPVEPLRALATSPGAPGLAQVQAAYEEVARISTMETVAHHELAPKRLTLMQQLGEDLEFMRYLCEQEMEAVAEGNLERGAAMRLLQEAVLRDHLAQWIDEACAKIMSRDESGFYAALAQLTRGVVGWEVASRMAAAPEDQRSRRCNKEEHRCSDLAPQSY